VFSGGFRREAAQAVAGVSMRILSELVDKSLLTREPNGRYQIHELLRQYAQTRLETVPEEAIRIHELHAAYYMGFLHERDNDLNGGRQREACSEIEAELDNIRAAWSWSVEHSRIESIGFETCELQIKRNPLQIAFRSSYCFLEPAFIIECESFGEFVIVNCCTGWLNNR